MEALKCLGAMTTLPHHAVFFLEYFFLALSFFVVNFSGFSLIIFSVAVPAFFDFVISPQVYPYKTKVCRALAESIDDKKRLVRKEAVKCRNEW